MLILKMMFFGNNGLTLKVQITNNYKISSIS